MSGLVAGFVAGAAGLLAGRKYTAGGLEQMSLSDRLDRIESRLGHGRQLKIKAKELDLKERLDAMEARVRHATDTLRRRSKRYASAGNGSGWNWWNRS